MHQPLLDVRIIRAGAVFFTALVVLATAVAAGEQVDWRRAVHAFEGRDLGQIQELRPGSVEHLSPDQRNAIALAAARSLSIADYIDAIGESRLWEHFTTPPAEDSPPRGRVSQTVGNQHGRRRALATPGRETVDQ